jgi:DNA-binding transcriptional regulator YiaG
MGQYSKTTIEEIASMTDDAVVQLLAEAYSDFVLHTKRRKVSDNVFARALGVSPASWNQWINGNRKPGYANCLQLAKNPFIGMRIFDVCNYPRPNEAALNDSRLVFVNANWDDLSEEDRGEIYNHVVEEMKKRGKVKSGP